MDKVEQSNFSHIINVSDRKHIMISGVKKIESFDAEEFLLESVMGYIIIKGEELEIIKLDTIQGNVSIKGKINIINYVDSNNKKEKGEGVLNKLFK